MPHRLHLDRSPLRALANRFSVAPRSVSAAVPVAFLLIAMLIAASCGEGLRPRFAEASDDAVAPLELDLAPAPEGTQPLPQPRSDFPLESSVDDALLSWAADRDIPYVDACAIVTPEAGQFCDVPTERDTVRLLGPSSSEIWYVVTVEEVFDLDAGAGYRVVRVEIAG